MSVKIKGCVNVGADEFLIDWKYVVNEMFGLAILILFCLINSNFTGFFAQRYLRNPPLNQDMYALSLDQI